MCICVFYEDKPIWRIGYLSRSGFLPMKHWTWVARAHHSLSRGPQVSVLAPGGVGIDVAALRLFFL
jgi:hypothetical protein